jgi:molybdopterin synthase catalytic subunit
MPRMYMQESPRIVLTRDAISAAPLANALRSHESGAIVTFEGTVRAERRNDGVALVALDYSAHDAMAVEQMKLLRERACEQFAIRDWGWARCRWRSPCRRGTGPRRSTPAAG